METIVTRTDLRNAIIELEKKQTIEESGLRNQFHEAYESIKPINLIKNSLKEATSDFDLKKTILDSTVGVTSGLLSGVLLKGIVKNPIKRFIGSVVIYGITNYASKHPETFQSIGSGLIGLFKTKSSDQTTEEEKQE
jgi:hypothetical protein